MIGLVPQKIFILDESLRNNILFGLDNKKYKDIFSKNNFRKISKTLTATKKYFDEKNFDFKEFGKINYQFLWVTLY